jgi:hypothetical protein
MVYRMGGWPRSRTTMRVPPVPRFWGPGRVAGGRVPQVQIFGPGITLPSTHNTTRAGPCFGAGSVYAASKVNWNEFRFVGGVVAADRSDR